MSLRRILLVGFVALVAGATAPPLRLETLDGAPVILEPRAGDTALLVHFWATWCPDCVEELPLVAQAASRCAGSGVRIVAVDVDEDPDTVVRFLRRHRVELPVLRDPRGRVWRSLGGFGLPTNLTWTPAERHIDVGARSRDAWARALAALGCSTEPAPRDEVASGS